MSVSFRSSSLSCGHWAFASRCTFQVPCQRACDRPTLSARCNRQYSGCVLLPSTLSAVKLRSLWVKQPSPKVALTLLTIKPTSCVLPFRLKFLLRVKRAYRRFLLLLTLRIKSPSRSAEDISRCGASRWRVFLVGWTPPFWTLQVQNVKHRIVPARSLRNTAYYRHSATRFYVDNILTRSDISLCNGHWNSRCYRLRDLLSLVGGYVIMGDCSYYRWHYPSGHFVHVALISRHLGTKHRKKTKKDPYSHKWTNNGNAKKRTALFA